MSVKLGRYLTEKEEVDHIDNNRHNDNPENLQVLTPQENKEKQARLRIINYCFICPVCDGEFNLTGKQLGKRRNKLTPTCSKTCGYRSKSYR